MKTSRQFNKLFVVLLAVGLQACQLNFTYFELREAEKAFEKGDFSRSVRYYRKVIERDPESEDALKSARAASRISLYELKNFDLAMQLFNHIVTHAQNENERKLALKELADIAFEKKIDYQRAIIEYNKLLTLGASRHESLKYKLRIAKSHFYISEFFQAESETRDALRTAEKGPEKFELELFLANILFNTKRMDEAIKAYKAVLHEYPELSKKEKVEMSLVVSLEETEKFQEAINLLELMKKDTSADADFLDLKIAKLRERMKNLPGARGLRR